MNTKSARTKQQIVLAAARVITQTGIQTLTLDAVAAAAGISKGGLLYHFPSKEALIIGMIDLFIEQFDRNLIAKLGSTSETPNAWIRAYIVTSLEAVSGEFELSAALMAAVEVNPALLDPLRERYAYWQSKFDQAVNPSLARIIRLAIDGWWITNLLGLAPTSDSDRLLLQSTLLDLVEKNL